MQEVEDLYSAASSPRKAQPAAQAWPAEVALLASHLSFARDAAVRRRINTLYSERPRRQGAELLRELEPLVASVVMDLAREFAVALGTTPTTLVEFLDPLVTAAELVGDHAIYRRLDRLWGGRHQDCITVRTEWQLRWPGPEPGLMVALHGTIVADGNAVPAGTLIRLEVGTETQAGAGAILMFSVNPLASVLEAAAASGISLVELARHRPETELAIAIPAGLLTLREDLATLNQREVRLTSAEAQLLRILACSRGRVVTRDELTEQMGMAHVRALELVVTGLRNALGDGVVATIYGSGYALEV